MLQVGHIEEIPALSQRPVRGLTIFTDAGGKTQKAAITWYTDNKWHDIVITDCKGSTQKLELRAVLEVFRRWTKGGINIVCDSLYVVGIVQRMERALLKEVSDEQLFTLLHELLLLLNERHDPYFITHIRSHSGLP